jgi:vacuolar iron transporter family protein
VRRASRYQRLLAREQGAASVYRALAQRRSGEEREILLALARAEERHAAHWAAKLHPSDRRRHRPGVRTRVLGWLARRLGSLVVLGLVQRAEAAGDYEGDPEATEATAADEQTHALVVAGLAQRARARSSGWFRAAVFGANDGLVSNFSLVLGMAGAGSSPQVVLLAGLADQEAEELGLVFRARGWRPTRPSGAPRRCVPEATTNRRAGTATPAPTRPAPTWSGRRWGRPGSASCRSPRGPPSRSCRSS